MELSWSVSNVANHIIIPKLWHNTFPPNCGKNVMTMWQDKKNLYHYFITFLSQFDKTKFCDLHLLWRTPTQPFCLTNGHKETKMWWECDDSKLVLIFWSTSFENSRHYKTWCQMPDALMSMPVWALPMQWPFDDFLPIHPALYYTARFGKLTHDESGEHSLSRSLFPS